MGNNLLGKIIGAIITTFVIAFLYGLFCVTMDYMNAPAFDPQHSGHRAAAGVYGLFGVAAEEIRNNDAQAGASTNSVAHKIAMPYALTADLSAIVCGKLIAAATAAFHTTERKVDAAAPARP